MVEHDFEEWRRCGITGTDAPKVVGVSPYGDALDVYISKVGLLPPIAQESGGALAAGMALEEVAAREFVGDNADAGILSCRRVPRRAHPRRKWQRVHLDRRVKTVDQMAALEIKTVSKAKFSEIERSGCPPHFISQLAHGCDVWDYTLGYLFILCRDTWQRKTIGYDFSDSNIIGDQRDLEYRLWHDHILKRTPPIEWRGITGTAASFDGVRAETDEHILALSGEVGAEFVALMFELRSSRDLAAEALACQSLAHSNIQDFMERNGFTAVEIDALADGVLRRLRYYHRQTAGRRTLDQKALLRFVQANHPDIDTSQFYRGGSPGMYSRDFWLRPTGGDGI